MEGTGKGCGNWGLWPQDELLAAQAEMRFRHDKKIQRPLAEALIRMERDEGRIAILHASQSARPAGSTRSQKPDAPSD
jgi:hypothetical protein